MEDNDQPNSKAGRDGKLFHAVAELMSGEEALRESEEKFSKVFHATPAIVAITTLADGRFIEVNEAFERFFGYGAAEVIGRTSQELGIWENPTDRAGAITMLRESGKVRDAEVNFRDKSGKILMGLYSAEIVEIKGEQYLLSLLNDITARKQAEEALRLNESRLEALLRLNEMTDASLHEVTDFALEEAVRLTRSRIGYLAFVNEDESVLTMHAWSREAMAECRIADKMQQFSVAAKGLWEEVIRQRKPIIINDYAASHPSKKGYPEGHVPVRRHMNAPIFDGGRIVAVAGVGNKEGEYDETDVRQLTLLIQGMWRIIQRRRTEEALQASEERYRRIVETSQEGIMALDAAARITYVNRRMAEMLGLTGAELLGRSFLQFVDDSTRCEVAARLEKRKKGVREQYEMIFLGKDGNKIWGSVSAIPILGAHGEFIGSIGMVSDLSERKRSAEKIEVLNTDLAARASELEIANEELEAFSYTVSHDLRKPLTAISGYSQVVLELCGRNLDEQCNNYLREILHGTVRMNQLINTLLNFSRRTRSELRRERVDLSGMAQTVLAELRLAAPLRRVSCSIAEGVEVNGDANLLRVVLDNLLGNAWKYTAKNEEAVIEFGVVDWRGKPACFIRDNGVGFDMACSNRLFSAFQRLQNAEEFEGIGIGLVTVQRIIQRHGGQVWAEGEMGKGATFYFTLG